MLYCLTRTALLHHLVTPLKGKGNEMSVLLHIKNPVIAHLDMPPAVKAAINDVLNAIDSDLDMMGYEHTAIVDDAVEALEKTLVEYRANDNEDESEVDNLALTRSRTRIPDDTEDHDDSSEVK